MSTNVDRGHVYTMDITTLSASRRRRRHTYTAEFKAKAVTACGQPGVSIAAIAMDLRLNANLLRRWVLESERTALLAPPPSNSAVRATLPGLVPASVAPTAAATLADSVIRITVQHRGTIVDIQCPNAAEGRCAVLLREWLG